MSAESSYQSKLGPVRRLKEPEKALMRRLLEISGDSGALLNLLDTMDVQEMSDGGMGSLYIVSRTKEANLRTFGDRIAELQFNDTDGVAILASLNVDEDGDLLELDVWKTDSSPTVQLKPP